VRGFLVQKAGFFRKAGLLAPVAGAPALIPLPSRSRLVNTSVVKQENI